ncbi:uncharacterized protein LOC144093312 [Stigmatopora argus]
MPVRGDWSSGEKKPEETAAASFDDLTQQVMISNKRWRKEALIDADNLMDLSSDFAKMAACNALRWKQWSSFIGWRLSNFEGIGRQAPSMTTKKIGQYNVYSTPPGDNIQMSGRAHWHDWDSYITISRQKEAAPPPPPPGDAVCPFPLEK